MAQRSNICVWDVTIPADRVDNIEILKDKFKIYCKKWVFQKETGISGYEHYQGRVSLKVKSRKGPVLGYGEHYSPTSNENEDNDFYCVKEDTRTAGPWSDKDLYIPKQVRNISLYPWQVQILEDAHTWDTRTINCIICPKGNIGKSTLSTYAGARGLARSLPMMESYKDYMRMVMDTPKSKLYLVDFPRSMNRVACASFWSAIETIKNGYAYDDRYGFREEYFDCPNIWVFMNTTPDENFLSKDRWKFWEVSNGELKFCNTKFETTGTIGTILIHDE